MRRHKNRVFLLIGFIIVSLTYIIIHICRATLSRHFGATIGQLKTEPIVIISNRPNHEYPRNPFTDFWRAIFCCDVDDDDDDDMWTHRHVSSQLSLSVEIFVELFIQFYKQQGYFQNAPFVELRTAMSARFCLSNRESLQQFRMSVWINEFIRSQGIKI